MTISAPLDEAVDPMTAHVVATSRPPETNRHTLKADLRFGLGLIKQYFKADRYIGGGLSVLILGLGATTSAVMLRAQIALASITDALVAKNMGGVTSSLATIALLG